MVHRSGPSPFFQSLTSRHEQGAESCLSLYGSVLSLLWMACDLLRHVVLLDRGLDCLEAQVLSINPSHSPLLKRGDLNYTSFRFDHQQQQQRQQQLTTASENQFQFESFHSDPLRWPKEASLATKGYTTPNFKQLLLGHAIPPETIIVNSSIIDVFPEGALHVATAASLYDDLPRVYHMDFGGSLNEMFDYLPTAYRRKAFLMWFPDYWQPLPFPIITKARSIGEHSGILLPLQYNRHFRQGFTNIERDKIPFAKKSATVVWRGQDSGRLYHPEWSDPENQRSRFMELWSSVQDTRIDAGFAGNMIFFKQNARYFKKSLSTQQQLQHRYLVSLEGEDVASGLKWMLHSNSVVLMVQPTRETWSLEGQLKPWVHFVPLRPDFRDLYDRVRLCESNLEECEAISRRATAYIDWFSDHKRNMRLGAKRLRQYLDAVDVRLL